jgi:molybdopterin converting factor subunit 1
MTIRVQLFAVAKQAAGADSVELALADGATVADVRRALVGRLPTLAAVQKHLLFAVNADYAGDTMVIKPNDEVACIPPVSGG